VFLNNFGHAHTAAPHSLQVHFINGSPAVERNTVRADILTNVSTANLLCELLRKDHSPVIKNCEW